jgi:rhodanese-related sulfurtransferase
MEKREKEWVRDVVPEKMHKFRITLEEFIDLYNRGEVELLDVRSQYEAELWGLKFGLQIPPDQLPDRLDELPKNKLIVTICPGKDRSNLVASYLREKGFNVRYLPVGLEGLIAHLRGGRAKELKPPKKK